MKEFTRWRFSGSLGGVDGFYQDKACGDCDDGCEVQFCLLAP
ncbi:(Na+)-NQR maturation NqrM [Serratia nematodiphila]